MKIIKDDKAASTLGLFFMLAILLIVGAFLYFMFQTISDSGGIAEFLADIGGELGSGLWGAFWGATTGFFGGAWKEGTTLGAKTQKYNIFRNARTIWRNYF